MKSTVGIVCHNEEKSLKKLLLSLNSGSNLNWIETILIVDNASTDRSVEIIRAFPSAIPIQLSESKSNNIGEARENIVRRCRTPFILWTDADCVVPENWAETLTQQMMGVINKDLRAAGVCGPNRLPENKNWKKEMNSFLDHSGLHLNSPQVKRPESLENTSHLPTTNAIYVVQRIEDAGGFKPYTSGEDSELGVRLKSLGFNMYLSPEPVVINNSASEPKDWAKRMFRFGSCYWLHSRRRVYDAWAILLLLAFFFGKTVFTTAFTLILFITLWIFWKTRSPKATALGLLTLSAYAAGFFLSPIRGWKSDS